MKLHTLINKFTKYFSIFCISFLVIGCTSHVVETNWGSSVKSMTAGQIYNPQAAKNPNPNAVVNADGEKSRLLQGVYRNPDIAKKSKEIILLNPLTPMR
jgi:hypothetical protein